MLHKFHRHLCFGTLAYSPHNWADPGVPVSSRCGTCLQLLLLLRLLQPLNSCSPLKRRIRAATAGNVQLIT